MEENAKRKYELAVLADSEAAGADLDKSLANLLGNGSVNILKKESIRQLNLAYPIKKHKTAVFLVYQFEALPEMINKIKDGLRFQSHILRYLLITPPIEKLSIKREKTTVTAGRPVKIINPEISSNKLLSQTLEQLEE